MKREQKDKFKFSSLVSVLFKKSFKKGKLKDNRGSQLEGFKTGSNGSFPREKKTDREGRIIYNIWHNVRESMRVLL